MNENKRIAFNSVIIYLRLCVVSLISIILSRVVLDALGVSDFGLYNVVGGIVLLLNVINSSMTSTTYRYLAFEIGKKENGNPNKIFNTSRIIHLAFAALIVLVGEPLGELYIINYLNVASESILMRSSFSVCQLLQQLSIPFLYLIKDYWLHTRNLELQHSLI